MATGEGSQLLRWEEEEERWLDGVVVGGGKRKVLAWTGRLIVMTSGIYVLQPDESQQPLQVIIK